MDPHKLINPHLDGDPFFWKAGPTGILLSHGFTATTAEVRPIAKIFHAQGFTISAPLLPGHNTRPEDLNRVHWSDWVSAVEESYQQLRKYCDRIIIGGESTGALLALYMASEESDIIAVLNYAPVIRLKMKSHKILQLILLHPFIPYVNKSHNNKNRYWQGYPVYPLKGAIQLFHLQREVYSRLPKVTQPLLIVQGVLDETVSSKAPYIIANRVKSPHIELYWMQESTHIVILDKELERVGELSIRFLNQLTRWRS